MLKVLCSTGALITRKNGRDHRLLAGFAEQLHCDGFEFMLYDSWYDKLDSIADDVKAMGLDIPAVHCEKSIGELIAAEDDLAYERFEMNCKAAERVGAKLLVLHLWNGLVSDSNFGANLKAYGRLADMAAEHGLTLTVENLLLRLILKSWRRNIPIYRLPLIRKWLSFTASLTRCMMKSSGLTISVTCTSTTMVGE